MFRSAAPISRSLSLSFCAYTYTHVYVRIHNRKPSLIPPRRVVLLVFLSAFSYYALPTAEDTRIERVLYDHANLSKKFVI